MAMRITFAGGGSGGHLYPLISIADELKKQTPKGEECVISYFGPKHPLAEEFEAREIRQYRIASSKLRRYFDIGNLIDVPKFFWSILQAIVKLYFVMPDVVFSKGGPGALAVVLAARWYRIPVIVHESDAVPGLTNRISAKFAKIILTAFDEASAAFAPAHTEMVGNPVRALFLGSYGVNRSMKSELQFDPQKPLALVLGGSQGSQRINAFILENAELILPEVQLYMQTGGANFEQARLLSQSAVRMLGAAYAGQFRIAPYFTGVQMRDALDAADLVVSRAGSGAIFEIAAAGKPAILIPLSDAAGDHQRANAYAYSKTGAAAVIEESNLTPNLVLSQIHTILNNQETLAKMRAGAHSFSRPDAAERIARIIREAVKG